MKIEFKKNGSKFLIDSDSPLDISIPLRFNGPQPNAYGVQPARSTPCQAGSLVGDTRLGGSCNFEEYTFIPHCNGTHTECIGHIAHQRISVNDCLNKSFMTAAVISIGPNLVNETTDLYPKSEKNDRLITEESVAAQSDLLTDCDAVVIRTLPNDREKLSREYGEDSIPPYFSNNAIEKLLDLGIEHILCDLPSIDRIFDDGMLSNHRLFWRIEEGKFELNSQSRRNCTITELIYVPDAITDGKYLLNLQIAPFESDVSPSRPILFEYLSS